MALRGKDAKKGFKTPLYIAFFQNFFLYLFCFPPKGGNFFFHLLVNSGGPFFSKGGGTT